MLVLATSWLLMNFSAAVPATYYSLYVLGLGGTPFIIGIIEFASFLALAFVQFPGGYVADKHGRRWLIVTFTFGLALPYLVLAVAPSWHFILIGVTLLNLFLVYQPALSAIMADSIPPEQRGMGFSIAMFVNNAASILSPAVAGFLFVQYGLISGVRIAYLMVVAFYLCAAFVRTRLTETLQSGHNEVSLSRALSEYPKAVKEGISVWRLLPRSMFFMFLTNALSSFTWAMSYPYLLVYATEVLHIKEVDWAIVMMVYTGSMIFAALPSGKLTDKIGRKKPLFTSWVFLAFFPILFLLGDLPLVFAAFLLFGTSNALFVASYQALEADLVPRELRGKEVGCSQFITYLLMSIGGLAGGFFYQFFSPTVPFIIAFLSTIPCAVITLFLIREPHKRET